MAGIAIIFALFVLFCVIGSALGWAATSRLSRVETTLAELNRRLRDLERRSREAPSPETAETETTAPAEAKASTPPPQAASIRPQPIPQPPPTEPRTVTAPPTPPETPAPHPATPTPPAPPPPRTPPEPGFFERLFSSMQRNWMAWLGGVCVALAGIFLVGYGIEMGYLGPRARIAAAIIAGLVLHAAAEYLRRKTGSAEPAFAAMAGGASITLYAAVFAALELYQLMSPGLAFTLLFLVSLATMALATVHGPLLAAIGILGAYVVPILVPNPDSSTLVALGYSLVVTTAALFLIRFVYRPWLWYGTLAGALGWWLISLGQVDADGYRGYYLAAFAYIALAIPAADWLLRRKPKDSDPATETFTLRERLPVETILVTVVLIALAQAASILHLGFTGFAQTFALWSPLTVVVLLALRSRDSLELAPWFLLITQLGAWFALSLDERGDTLQLLPLAGSARTEFLAFALAQAALFSIGLWLARRGRPFSHLHASLVWLAPVLWIALAYRLGTDLSTSWEWALGALMLGLAYLGIAGRRLEQKADDASTIWLILGGHIAYSLAAVMFFREATLTLALAVQIVSLTWLDRRFALPALEWLIKGVLAVIVARLTLNPWLLSYPVDTHWSLWTYGGATLSCFIAARLAGERLAIRKWLEAASLHLFVLFLGAEVRYQLYDGRVFIEELTLTETAINSVIWGALALTYFNRALASRNMTAFYITCSRILLVLALAAYAASLTFLNPLFGADPVGTRPVWNLLLLAYGAPVLVAVAIRFWYDTRFRDLANAVAAAGLFVFVTLEIRHLWQGALDLDLGTSNGEIYTYSAVWLAMAVATMLSATKLGSAMGYRAGIGLLCLVIAKIFLYDMAGLEGLLRVASFLGLGLALIGLAWLYQRTAREMA